MRRTPTTRAVALGLELAGALAVLAAIATYSRPLALLVAGVLLMVAAQFMEAIL